jgi:hypothetical protein
VAAGAELPAWQPKIPFLCGIVVSEGLGLGNVDCIKVVLPHFRFYYWKRDGGINTLTKLVTFKGLHKSFDLFPT